MQSFQSNKSLKEAQKTQEPLNEDDILQRDFQDGQDRYLAFTEFQ